MPQHADRRRDRLQLKLRASCESCATASTLLPPTAAATLRPVGANNPPHNAHSPFVGAAYDLPLLPRPPEVLCRAARVALLDNFSSIEKRHRQSPKSSPRSTAIATKTATTSSGSHGGGKAGSTSTSPFGTGAVGGGNSVATVVATVSGVRKEGHVASPLIEGRTYFAGVYYVPSALQTLDRKLTAMMREAVAASGGECGGDIW